MVGLFVQKHVEAVRAQGVDVRVIFSQTWQETWRQWRALRREGWWPDLVQLNVIQKQGALALWLKKRYGIPYVIIEHWTGYLPENLSVRANGFHTRFMKRVCQEAEVVMPVSEHLGRAMQGLGFQAKRWFKINNVVDDFFFEENRTPQGDGVPADKRIKTILNITCFDEPHKNVKGLLRVAKTLSEKRQDWQLVLVGTGVDYEDVRAYADSLNIPQELLRWTGELSPMDVSAEFDKTDIFVLSSNYENAPVVISESLAKGVPVVSTSVGGIPEMVSPQSGILVAPGNEDELKQAILYMLDHYREYDKASIRKEGKQYSFATVGRQLKAIYEEVYSKQG